MGKSLTGKELGQGITQRKDGRFQARFTNRFGKRQTIYGKTINEIRQKLRTEQYEDEKQINVVSSDMILDEWFEIWMNTCKNNCRDTSRHTYRVSYNRIKESLGWRKLSGLNLIVMQQAVNELKTDVSRKDTKKLLVDMLNKAIDSDLLHKNVAKQINTVVTKDSAPEEPRVLTIEETEWFLEAASHYRYFNEFSLALETGMRIGEIIGLKWSDIDFVNRTIYVNRTLVYIKSDDASSPNFNKWGFEFHEPKTDKGRRKIPMTLKAYQILKRQQLWKRGMETNGYQAPEGYEDLVFTTTKNTPISPRDTTVVMKFITERIRKKRPDFEPVTPHTLRHTFATRCIERGMNPKTLQIILGHSTIQLTMNLYCHVTDDMLISEMSNTMYLVTGAAGFLGGTICRQLVDRGEKVRAFVLPNDKAMKFVPKEAEIVEGDLCDMESLRRFFTVPEGTETIVLHIASIVTVSPEYNQKVMDVNVSGTKNIIELCLEHKECKKLVYCSSTGAIPELPKGQKIKEVDHFDADKVVGCYSQSKALATQAVLDAVKEKGLHACVVHPSGILGPEDFAVGETTGTVIQIINGEMPMGIDGSFNLCDVRDLAQGTILAADKGKDGSCYILGNKEVSFKKFSELLMAESGCKPIKAFLPLGIANFIAGVMEKQAKRKGTRPLMTTFSVYNLARNNEFDCTKAQKELGYKTRSYKETIRDEVAWLKKAGKIA